MMQNFEWLQFKRATPNAEQVRLSVIVDRKSKSARMALVIGRKVTDQLKWAHQDKVQIAAGKPDTPGFGKLLIAPADQSRAADPLTLSTDTGKAATSMKVSTAVVPAWMTKERLSVTECTFKVTPNKWLEVTVPPVALAVGEDEVTEAGAEPVAADPAEAPKAAETKNTAAPMLAEKPVTEGDALQVAEDAFEPKKQDAGEQVQPSEKASCTHGVWAAPDRKSETAAPQDSKPVGITQIRQDKIMACIRSMYVEGGLVISDKEIAASCQLRDQDVINAMAGLRKSGVIETAVDRRAQPFARTIYLPEKGDTAAKAIAAPPPTKKAETRKVETINDRVWHALDLAGESLTINTGRGVDQRYIVNNRPMGTKAFLNHVNALLEQDGVEKIKMPRNLMEPLDIYPRARAA